MLRRIVQTSLKTSCQQHRLFSRTFVQTSQSNVDSLKNFQIKQARDVYQVMCKSGASFDEKDMMTDFIKKLSNASTPFEIGNLVTPSVNETLKKWKEDECQEFDDSDLTDDISNKFGIR